MKALIVERLARSFKFGLGFFIATALGLSAVHAVEPTVQAIPGKPFFLYGNYDLGSVGYSLSEYSIAGTATSYKLSGKSDGDQKWDVKEDKTAPYVTRTVVMEPSDSAKFNGTVIVEWLNVSGGLDVPVEWTTLHRELIRNGFAYVGVSAQRVGIEGGPSITGAPPMALKKLNAARYGGLSHPGDAFSYDIFSQVGRLLNASQGAELLGPLHPKRVLAAGESQSAVFLTTYVNAIDPVAKVYDGFLIHSRFGNAAPLDGASLMDSVPPVAFQSVRFRDSLRVPVQVLITETDLLGLGLGPYYDARQAATKKLRVWEIAGAAHADNYLISVGAIDSGAIPIEKLAAAWQPTTSVQMAKLPTPMNNGPQHHYVAEAALHHLERWVEKGLLPPITTPLEALPGTPIGLVADRNGNTKGGVRTPWLDVPTSRLSGKPASPGIPPQAALFGSVEPFDQAALARLYPGGRSDYLKQFETALNRSIAAGFILPADKQEILDIARVSYAGVN